MEVKLFVPFVTLLLLHSGFADHDQKPNTSPPVSEEVPVSPSGGVVSDPSVNLTAHAWNNSESNWKSGDGSGNNTTTEQENIPDALGPEDHNVSDAGKNDTIKNESPTLQSQPPVPPTEGFSSNSSDFSSNSSVTSAANDTMADIEHSSNHTNFSEPSPSLDAVPLAPTTQPTQPGTTSTTSPTTEQIYMLKTSPHPSHKSATTRPTADPSSLSSTHPETTSKAHPKPSPAPRLDTSTQTRVHTGNPSQLNVGGDTLITHDTQALDPLLAGLVSAFILTAVIVTLLLFLKLRRRDSRPEFRRLQDLPMDDMMEDTPLSMYSY